MSHAEDELVLLIHGTFAAPEEGTLKWWEIGSGPWKEIEQRLPSGTRLADSREIFDWSGENLERDRYKAGLRLFDRLITLEKQGRPYHLVGHSHGGSVVWHALQESIRKRIGKKRPVPHHELANLRSWTTVGTPFLQYDESAMGRWRGAIITKLLMVVMPVLSILLFLWILKARDAIEGFVEQFIAVSPWAPVFILIPVFVIAVIVMPGLYVWISAIRLEALFIRQAAMVRNHAMLVFGGRWLGIRSREDEAINGLKSTVKLTIQVLPRLNIRADRIFKFDRRVWTFRLLLKALVAPVLNRTFVPYGNNLILGMLAKSAQGDDRPGCGVTSVSEGPICMQERYHYPSLPASHDEALVAAANENLIARAPELVPKVRTLLADFSSGVALLGTTKEDSGIQIDGGELVHTSYFESRFVLDLIAHHVQVHERDVAGAAPRTDALAQWHRSTCQDVKQNVIDSPMVRNRSLTRLARRNPCAFWSVGLFLVGMILLTLAVGSDSQTGSATAIAIVLLGLILGRIGQLRAERGARFGRTANLGVNLGLIPLTIAVSLATVLAVSALWERISKPEAPGASTSITLPVGSQRGAEGMIAHSEREVMHAQLLHDHDGQSARAHDRTGR